MVSKAFARSKNAPIVASLEDLWFDSVTCFIRWSNGWIVERFFLNPYWCLYNHDNTSFSDKNKKPCLWTTFPNNLKKQAIRGSRSSYWVLRSSICMYPWYWFVLFPSQSIYYTILTWTYVIFCCKLHNNPYINECFQE